MNGEGVGAAIGLEVIPGERMARHGRDSDPGAQVGLTTAFNRIEVDHHSPVRWPPLTVYGVFLSRRKPPVCSLKYSPGS